MEALGQRADQLVRLASDRLVAERARKAAPSSKYDFVKVKVWLGEHMEHYYVLSRFLISRMLTVTRLPQQKAIKIALEVKKYLVDNGKLDISQDELEAALFSELRARGYGDEYVTRYRMVSRFFQAKRPLVVLVCGTACTGKSTLAQQLASRLNLPNVLQTDVLYELLRTGGLGPLSPVPLWERAGLESGADLVSEFQQECRVVRRALDGDLTKCIKDGKSLIVEGLHLDPGLFLAEFGGGEEDPGHRPGQAAAQPLVVLQSSGGSDAVDASRRDVNGAAAAGADSAPGGRAGGAPLPLLSGGPVFVPLILAAEERDHRMLMHSWHSGLQDPGGAAGEAGGGGGEEGGAAGEAVLGRFREVQHYLTGYERVGVPVFTVAADDFSAGLDMMHEYILGILERIMAGQPPEAGQRPD